MQPLHRAHQELEKLEGSNLVADRNGLEDAHARERSELQYEEKLSELVLETD